MSSNQNSLGWGIIGTGRQADRFMAPAIKKSGHNHLVGVFDIDIQRAQQFAAKHDRPSAYDHINALMDNPSIDVVYIGSPNHIHKEHVLLAAAAGKHILCDKPMTTNEADAHIMVNACRKAGVKLGVGFHLRHNPVHQAVKEKIQAHLLGEILMIEVQYMHVTAGAESSYKAPTWRTDPATAGGADFIGTGVHAIDLLRCVSGQEVSSLAAFADKNWKATGSERLIQASMYLSEGSVASLSGGMMKYPSNGLTVCGTQATIRCSGSLGYLGGGRLEMVSDSGSQVTEFPQCDVYLREIEAFAESVRLNKEPNASGMDGLQAVKITTGIYDSLKKGSLLNLL